MAAPINKYVYLKDVINLYNEASKKSDGEFIRLWRISFRGLVQMGLNAFWDAKEVVLPVNSNLTVTLPDDYLMYVRVGTYNQNGEFQILNVNNQLGTFGDLSSDRLSKVQAQVNAISGYLLQDGSITSPDDVSMYPYYGKNNYGTGSRLLTPGSCKVDEKNRVIILDIYFPLPNVALEYIYAPEQDLDYQIPIEFQEAMIAWLNWQDKIYVPATTKGGGIDKQIAAQNFKNQLLLAKKMHKPVRIAEIELGARLAQKWAVKG